jgi:hypothetical protein
MSVAVRHLATTAADFEAEFQRVLHWSAATDAAIETRVAEILADVRARGDAAVLERLAAAHRRFNEQHFGGELGEIPIRLSSRMRRRLGELAVSLETGRPQAITLSRRHLRVDSWAEVEHTLLHEMVHQWQAESGHALDHGRKFRARARAVGIVPRAVRRVD